MKDLMLAYLLGTIEDEQLAELEDILKDNGEARELLARLSSEEAVLRQALQRKGVAKMSDEKKEDESGKNADDFGSMATNIDGAGGGDASADDVSSMPTVPKGTANMGATQVDPAMSKAQHLDKDGTAQVAPSDAGHDKPDTGPELLPGAVLGKCRIEKELGRGGMGAVYLATHTTLDVKVAVKVLPPAIAAKNKQFAERFMREARLAAKIKHGNIIQVMDAEQDEKSGLYYIILEFVDGGSVRDLMRRGSMPELQAIQIARAVAEALDSASDMNIVHRDIKPDNIMLTKKGDVKLADMGIAKQHTKEDVGMTMDNAMMGTPAYISPEQAMDAKTADARADIYSLGATLYHMLVGAPPFEGETTYKVLTKLATEPTPNPLEKRPDLSQAVVSICMRMMAKNKTERPQTARELVQELKNIEGALQSGATVAADGTALRLDLPTQPLTGTATQGVTATDAPGGGTALATAGPEPAIQLSSSGMKMLLAAAVIALVAIVAFQMRSGSRPATPSNGSSTSNTTNDPATKPEVNKPVAVENTPRVPVKPAVKPALVEAPKPKAEDKDLVAQAIASIEKAPIQELKMGTAILKKSKNAGTWPSQPEIKLAGFSSADAPDHKNTARKAAYEQAMTKALQNALTKDDQSKARNIAASMIDKKEDFVRNVTTYDEGKKDGVYYVAMGVTPRPGKIGKELFTKGIKLKDLYSLVGKPSVGVDIPESMDGNDAPQRRAQAAIEQILREQGVGVVSIKGLTKEQQKEVCDVVISGSAVSEKAYSGKMPGVGIMVHRYSTAISVNVLMTPTNRKFFTKVYTFPKPGVKLTPEQAKVLLLPSKGDAARVSLEAAIKAMLPDLTTSLTKEWVMVGGEVDFWVGIKGLGGATDARKAQDTIAGVEGIKNLIRRHYKNGILELGLQCNDTAAGLAELIEKKTNLKMQEQRGLRLIFEAK